jgi:hypothetical protein
LPVCLAAGDRAGCILIESLLAAACWGLPGVAVPGVLPATSSLPVVGDRVIVTFDDGRGWEGTVVAAGGGYVYIKVPSPFAL